MCTFYHKEGSLEAKLLTIWTDGKAAQLGRSPHAEKTRKGEDAGVRKGRKVAKHSVSPLTRGSKSRLAKAAGAEPAGQTKDEKLHTVVTRSTFASQNVQNTSALDHFWELRCRKSARHCGTKHIFKSNVGKYTRFGPLLEAPQLRTTFGS